MKIDLEKIKRLPPDVRKEFMKTYLQHAEKKKERRTSKNRQKPITI